MLRRAAASLSAGCAAYGACRYVTDEGFGRALTLYASLGPVVLHYRLVEASQARRAALTREDASREWRALDRRWDAACARPILLFRIPSSSPPRLPLVPSTPDPHSLRNSR